MWRTLAHVTLNKLAGQVGLSYHAGNFLAGPYLSGHYRNRWMSLEISGINPPCLRIAMSVSNVANLSLKVTNQSIFNQFEQSLGLAVRTGDNEFDRGFAVSGRPIVFARQLSSSATLRRRLSQCYGLTIRLTAEKLRLVGWASYLADTPYMLHLFNLMDVLAKAVESYQTDGEKR